MQDGADPHARERALEIARKSPPPGVSPQVAAGAVAQVLNSIGDTCPECPPNDSGRPPPRRLFEPILGA